MSEKTPITRILEEMPKTAKRLWQFLLNPSIPSGSVTSTTLNSAHIDLFTTASVIATVIFVGSNLTPGLFEINPSTLINWPLFALLLMVNAVLFSAILYLLLLIPLLLKAKEWHSPLIYHSFRFFAVQNIFVSILFVIGLNRLIVKGSLTESTGAFEYGLTLIVTLAALAFTVWLLALPISAYIRRYFHSGGAYVLGFSAIIITSILNPVIASGYFSNVVDYKEFCSQLVSFRFQNEIESGKFSKDCIIGKCLSAKGKEVIDSVVGSHRRGM